MDDKVILDAWRDRTLVDLIIETVGPLVGEPFMDMGRAADMLWLGFGEEVLTPGNRGPDRYVARHRIHVQTAFRLDSPTGTILASGDMYLPANPEATEAFDWGTPGTSVFDAAVKHWWSKHSPGSLQLERIAADGYGGIELTLSGEFVFRIFPRTSGAREHWRYFQADSDESHFVVLPPAPFHSD